MKRFVLCLILLAVSFVVLADSKTRTSRTHFSVVTTSDHRALYEVTRITNVNAAGTHILYLVLDKSDGARYVLESRRNYSSQTARFEIRTLAKADTQSAIASEIQLPLVPDSPEGSRDQLRALAARGDVDIVEASIPVRVETLRNGSRSEEASNHSDWRGSGGRVLREKMRQSVDRGFLDKVKKMQRELFHLPHFQEFCSDLASYVLEEGCNPTPHVAVTNTGTECEFDAAFGYPCK